LVRSGRHSNYICRRLSCKHVGKRQERRSCRAADLV